MKTIILLLIAISSTVSIATAQTTISGVEPIVSITPGVYNTSAGDYPISLKKNESGNLIYKDYRETVEYINIAPGTYKNSKSPSVYLTSRDGINIAIGEDNSGFRKAFKLYAPANATPENGAIAFPYHEDIYYATRATTSLFIGMYKYPGKEPRFFEYSEGEPIIILNDDQTGRYQRHGMPAIPIKWWIESDYKGNLKVIKGDLADRYYLVVQFGPGSQYDLEGTYDRMYLDVYKDGSKVVILGERVKQL